MKEMSQRALRNALSCFQSERLLPALKVQTTALRTIEDFMVSRDFVQLMPIITSRVTDPLGPDPGSSVIVVPRIKYYDEELVLTQSMILHKQLSLLTGAHRIFIMSPNVRLENMKRKETGKHLFEFTQMDFEMGSGLMEDVMSLLEDLLIEVISTVVSERKEELERLGRELQVPSKPFTVYTSHQLQGKYGEEWENRASLDHKSPFWITCFRREFYDREDPENPGHFRNYDLVYPEGYGEGVSGGEREWEYKRILARIEKDGLNPKDFEPYLQVAETGLLSPSAGAGIGVERLVRFLVGAKHIGDIQPFRRVPGEEVIL